MKNVAPCTPALMPALSGFSLACLLACSTASGGFVTARVTGDSNADQIFSSESPIAEARFGNGATNGDWEAGVGNNTGLSSSSSVGQWKWSAGATESFSLNYDGVGTLSLTLGSNPSLDLSFSGDALSGNALALRARSTEASELTFSNGEVTFASQTVALETIDSQGTNLLSSFGEGGGDAAKYLFLFSDGLSPLFDLGAAWMLSGDLNFNWLDGETLRGSRLDLTVKVGNGQPPENAPVVPELSASMTWLTGVGLAALFAIPTLRRRRETGLAVR